MNRILKERYKHIPLEQFNASLVSNLLPAAAVIETEGEGSAFCQYVALAIEDVLIPSDGYVAEDPVLRANNLDATKKVEGVQIDIPANSDADEVIYLHFRYPEAESKYVLRNRIRVGVNGSVKVVVYHHKSKGAVINALTQIDAAAGATVEVVEITETQGTYLGTILTSEQRDARVNVTTIDINNDYLRRNHFVTLAEKGSECSLSGVYTTNESQYCDNYIRMNHAAAHCTSDQLYKGVVGGESHAVFTGHIYVAKDAQKTVSLQENHNILLSNSAKVDTRPQLEIYADDVKCNHGATIGRLDPNAIYYMRQRGISIDAAKRLQLEGFVSEIATHVPTGELKNLLVDKISERLQQI